MYCGNSIKNDNNFVKPFVSNIQIFVIFLLKKINNPNLKNLSNYIIFPHTSFSGVILSRRTLTIVFSIFLYDSKFTLI